jgi:hypothetical protein
MEGSDWPELSRVLGRGGSSSLMMRRISSNAAERKLSLWIAMVRKLSIPR